MELLGYKFSQKIMTKIDNIKKIKPIFDLQSEPPVAATNFVFISAALHTSYWVHIHSPTNILTTSSWSEKGHLNEPSFCIVSYRFLHSLRYQQSYQSGSKLFKAVFRRLTQKLAHVCFENFVQLSRKFLYQSSHSFHIETRRVL